MNFPPSDVSDAEPPDLFSSPPSKTASSRSLKGDSPSPSSPIPQSESGTEAETVRIDKNSMSSGAADPVTYETLP